MSASEKRANMAAGDELCVAIVLASALLAV